MGRAVWGDTRLVLPPQAPPAWHDALTDRPVRDLGLGSVLARLPVALVRRTT